MTRTLGIIGSGMIGSALARLATAAGIDVVLANSRAPQTLADLVAELGPRARAATPAEAAAAGDLVAVSVPLRSLDALPAAALAGKVVIDTMNYYPERDGRMPALETGHLTSSTLVQQHLAGARVVKAGNNVDFRRLLTLARPSGAPDRSALPVAGDDADAIAAATALLDALGYDIVVLGTLADSWRSEPGTPVYTTPYFPHAFPADLSHEDAYRWFLETAGTPVPAPAVERLLATAVPGGGGIVLPDDLKATSESRENN